MEWLDQNIDVKAYQYEGLAIPYVSNTKTGKQRKYYPDFYIEYQDGHFCLVEIKPSSKLHQRIVQKKISAASDWSREHGCSLEIITEHELKALGLMK